MAAAPVVYATISVTSGHLCFGALNNIWNGASTLPVQGLPKVRFQRSGTVKVHRIEYNVAARNGTWNAFQLIDLDSKKAVAWFLAHSGVDPKKEIDKILRVSGSPYEYDSGSSMNNDKTEAEGVFLINRYDWGYYDKRSADGIGKDMEEGESDRLANGNSLGVVDIAEAKSMVSRWKEQRPSQREWSKGGAWLYCPGGEYMFGRFGFDDDHIAARSFLFFSTNTYFTRTAFAGLDQSLRKEETDEERFERRLREGYDFSGVEELRELSKPQEDPSIMSFYPPPPPLGECLGPYDLSDHVLRAQDIDALRDYRDGLTPYRLIGEFVEPWVEPLYDLTNEMLLSYLQRTIVPRMANRSLSDAVEALFPPGSRSGGESADAYYYPSFLRSDKEPIPNFDVAFVSGRIKSFLTRFEDDSVRFDDQCIAGITRVAARLLAEVLECANKRSLDVGRTKILPCDVRLYTYPDEGFRCLQFSRVFWEGRDGGTA